MKLVICCVRDRAANMFAQPMFVAATGIAIRSFINEVNRAAPDNQLYLHPADFDLYELGTYDDSNAKFEALPEARQICIGKDVKEKQE